MLTVYTLDQSEQWDTLVRSFKNYDVYWLSGYVKAFYLHGDGEPLIFYYEKGDTRGINVAMKRDVAVDSHFDGKLPKGQYYDFATPYGYGGWLIEGEGIEELFRDYREWMENSHIISEFIRFHPIVGNHVYCGKFYDVVPMGEVVHMDLSSPETIWGNLTSKNRNVIRKAVKCGVKIYNGRFPEIYDKFLEIYNETMDRDNAGVYYYFSKDFYKSLLEDIPQNAQVFFAEKDGIMIAASIILTANGRMNYHLSGSLREYGSLAPTNLLLYQAALWGYSNGCRTMYLGGGVGSGGDSLFRFKRAFYKGDLHKFYIGRKIYSKDAYRMLCEMRGNIESLFFPLYRS